MLPHPDHGEIQGPVECGEAASVLVCFPSWGMEGTSARENDKSILVKMGRWAGGAKLVLPVALPQTRDGDRRSGELGPVIVRLNGAGSQGHMPHGWRSSCGFGWSRGVSANAGRHVTVLNLMKKY
jgi:hypothetical protein